MFAPGKPRPIESADPEQARRSTRTPALEHIDRACGHMRRDEPLRSTVTF